jgi:hypothetical protein
MTAILVCSLLAQSLAPAGQGHSVTRAGIRCVEDIQPPSVSLTGEARLTLSAEGDAPLAVEPITFPDPPGWRVRAVEPAAITDLPGNKQLWRQTLRLIPDKPGELALLPPTIRVRAGGREVPVEIDWKPLTVHVTSMLPRADLDEAHGVTGPEPAPPGPTPFWRDERFWAVVMVLFAVGAAVFAGRRRPPPPEPELPPVEWANAQLDRLAAADPANTATADALAELIRGFLVRRHLFPAAGKTTAELTVLLHALPPDQADGWHSLLERCDLARFANVDFSAGGWADVLDRARRLAAASLSVGEATGSAAGSPAGENA